MQSYCTLKRLAARGEAVHGAAKNIAIGESQGRDSLACEGAGKLFDFA